MRIIKTFSIADYKIYFYNGLIITRFISLFRIILNKPKKSNHSQNSQLWKNSSLKITEVLTQEPSKNRCMINIKLPHNYPVKRYYSS